MLLISEAKEAVNISKEKFSDLKNDLGLENIYLDECIVEDVKQPAIGIFSISLYTVFWFIISVVYNP